MHNTINRRHALLLAASATASSALAQSDFPDRPLKIIVPQPPGGGFDFVARTLAEPLQRGVSGSAGRSRRPVLRPALGAAGARGGFKAD